MYLQPYTVQQWQIEMPEYGEFTHSNLHLPPHLATYTTLSWHSRQVLPSGTHPGHRRHFTLGPQCTSSDQHCWRWPVLTPAMTIVVIRHFRRVMLAKLGMRPTPSSVMPSNEPSNSRAGTNKNRGFSLKTLTGLTDNCVTQQPEPKRTKIGDIRLTSTWLSLHSFAPLVHCHHSKVIQGIVREGANN